MAYYAWSNINPGTDKGAKAGDSVTADKLGLSKDEFQELIDTGVVREQEYPKEALDGNLSPSEIAKRDLAIAAGNIEASDVVGAGVVEKKGKADE